jgi:hypothetical protein
MLQQFFDQHLVIALNRDEEPMAFVADGRGGGWVVDQLADQRREMGRGGGHHCFGKRVDTPVTRLGRHDAIVIPGKSFRLIGDPDKGREQMCVVPALERINL